MKYFLAIFGIIYLSTSQLNGMEESSSSSNKRKYRTEKIIIDARECACGRVYSNYEDLKRHVKNNYYQSEEKSYGCPYSDCKVKHRKIGSLIQHFPVHTNEYIYSCPHCKFKTTKLLSMITHKHLHSKFVDAFKYLSKYTFTVPMDNHTKTKCPTCLKEFNYLTHLLKHVNAKHNESVEPGDLRSSCDDIKNHSQKSKKLKYKTPAGHIFDNFKDFREHVKQVYYQHEQKLYVCTYLDCKLKSSNLGLFIKHFPKHSGEPINHCFHCNFESPSIDKIEIHSHLHSTFADEFKYLFQHTSKILKDDMMATCPICKIKQYISLKRLLLHVRWDHISKLSQGSFQSKDEFSSQIEEPNIEESDHISRRIHKLLPSIKKSWGYIEDPSTEHLSLPSIVSFWQNVQEYISKNEYESSQLPDFRYLNAYNDKPEAMELDGDPFKW